MNIGVIGAGNIGGTVGGLWAKAGHLVRFGTRHPQSLGPLLAEAGPNASAGSPEEGSALRRDRVLLGALRRLAIAGAGAFAARLGQSGVGLRQSLPGARRRIRTRSDRGRRRRRRPRGTLVARRTVGPRLQLGLLQNLADGGAPRRRPRRHPARERRR